MKLVEIKLVRRMLQRCQKKSALRLIRSVGAQSVAGASLGASITNKAADRTKPNNRSVCSERINMIINRSLL